MGWGRNEDFALYWRIITIWYLFSTLFCVAGWKKILDKCWGKRTCTCNWDAAVESLNLWISYFGFHGSFFNTRIAGRARLLRGQMRHMGKPQKDLKPHSKARHVISPNSACFILWFDFDAISFSLWQKPSPSSLAKYLTKRISISWRPKLPSLNRLKPRLERTRLQEKMQMRQMGQMQKHKCVERCCNLLKDVPSYKDMPRSIES